MTSSLNPITKLPENCVVFDTETTGFEPSEGHRIVEFGAVRMRDGLPTKETFHTYICPERSVPQGAVDVHGLTEAFLADKPLFAHVVDSILEFIGSDQMIAHNAPFDLKHMNAEFERLGLPLFNSTRIFDSLVPARILYPGAQVSLDALCRRHKISLTGRDKHGALLDSQLLCDVIVEMGGGRQQTLFAPVQRDTAVDNAINTTAHLTGPRPPKLVLSPEVLANHQQFVAQNLGENSLWAHIYKEM